ncbi:MAG: ABC transporter permease [Candidatus Aminicenantes bacterium]|nr:ABC transporter permease [Candidatus Aminicenantes bacterium]
MNLIKIKKYLSFKEFLQFLKGLYFNRKLILKMTKRDFRNKSLGSLLGILWSFIQPIIFILVIWCVFELGFKSKPMGDFPFILWLASAMILWLFFADSFLSATNSVFEYSYLVKKVRFRVSMLPIVKILSALIVHLFFLVFLFLMFLIYGIIPGIYALQLIYYLFATIVLVLGLSWITSAINLFFRDISQIVQIILQIGFWFTPIFWSLVMIPEKYRFIFRLNPVYYLTMGYRDSMINKVWFWERPELTIYFWCFTLLVFAIGSIIFRRLRPHFADVL